MGKNLSGLLWDILRIFQKHLIRRDMRFSDLITHFVRIDAHILDNFCRVLIFIWYSVSSQFYENLVTAVCSIFFCFLIHEFYKYSVFRCCFNPFPQAYFWASFCWVLKEVYLLSFIYSLSSQFLWELSDSILCSFLLILEF